MAKSGEGQGVEGASAEGELVRVAYANDPIEAEMLQGLLAGGDIPSLLQPSGLNGAKLGFAGLRPGYGGGPQLVMVHANRVQDARTLLAETLVEDEAEALPEIANAGHLEDAEGRSKPRGYGLAGAYARIYLFSLLAMGLAFGIFLLLRSG